MGDSVPTTRHSPRRLHTYLAAGLLLCLCLSGCSSGSKSSSADTSPKVDDSSPSASTTPSTSPSGPKPGGLRTSYPDAELTFTKVPKQTGPTHAAVEAYLKFENIVRTSFRDAKPPVGLGQYASPQLVQNFVASAANERQQGIHFQGPTAISVTHAEGNVHIVALQSCLDVTDTVQVIKGKPKPLNGAPRVLVRVVLTNQNGWKVTEYTNKETAC